MIESKVLLRAFVAFLMLSGNPVVAQTIPDASETVQACRTNLGPEGHLISGLYGMVYAPANYDDVRTNGTELIITPQYRDELGALIIDPPATKQATESGKALIEFTRGNDVVVHRCNVETLAYDPDLQDLSSLQIGDCDLKLVAGLPQLFVGHAQVWETPQDAPETFNTPVAVMDMSTLSKRMVLPLGKSPGVAVIVWIGKEKDGIFPTSICPMNVASAKGTLGTRGLDDKDLCKDLSGAPMRLSVGQTVTMQIPKGDGRAFSTEEYMVVDHAVANAIGFDKANNAPIIEGIASGTTSVALLNEVGGTQARICEVQVE